MSVFKLPTLPVNWRTQPELFERYWSDAMTSIEKTLNAILDIPEIQTALTAVEAATVVAQDAADTAQTAADNANAAASSTKSETSIVNSYVANFTPPLVSSDASGNITVAPHDRVYGDPTLNPTVAVNGATFPTLGVAGDVVRVFYDDLTRAGGAVAYQVTIDPAAPPVQGGNRHSVGSVTVPAAGTQSGNYVKPPGFVDP